MNKRDFERGWITGILQFIISIIPTGIFLMVTPPNPVPSLSLSYLALISSISVFCVLWFWLVISGGFGKMIFTKLFKISKNIRFGREESTIKKWIKYAEDKEKEAVRDE